MKTIKNIIFDLGAVILNLDPGRTDAAFAALVGDQEKFLSIRQDLFEQGVFHKFETNEVKEEEFIQQFKKQNPHPLTDGQVRMAWSSMLLDMPVERIELLKELKKEGYNLYLLSNINSIHLKDVYTIIKNEHGTLDFDSLFIKPYYSHLIGRRKPDTSTFQFVVDDAGLDPAETLFIDDNADNIQGARAVGLYAVHHLANTDLRAALRPHLNA